VALREIHFLLKRFANGFKSFTFVEAAVTVLQKNFLRIFWKHWGKKIWKTFIEMLWKNLKRFEKNFATTNIFILCWYCYCWNFNEYLKKVSFNQTTVFGLMRLTSPRWVKSVKTYKSQHVRIYFHVMHIWLTRQHTAR